MYYYFLPEPPYVLFLVGLFIGITCGAAFEATLKQKVKQWSKKVSQPALNKIQGTLELRLSYFGICLGICIFLASALEIFSVDRTFAYGFSLFTTLLICGLIWSQLGKVLIQLQQGGSQALDLDMFT
jgi:D-alanyl-lipoteichoic acid acyltransferase DltB (MBOAT superfamily)